MGGGQLHLLLSPLCAAPLDVHVNQVFSQVHVRIAYLFFALLLSTVSNGQFLLQFLTHQSSSNFQPIS